MRRFLLLLNVLLFTATLQAAAAPPSADWQAKVNQSMPLLGHRNWILVVDSAYPLQSSPGIETIETGASQIDVVNYVLGAIDRSIQVRPVILMDAELPFVPDTDAPGASQYRAQIGQVLNGFTIDSERHEKIIADIAEASKDFHILVLKTNMTIPYSSVFIRLDCKYWSADAEKRMRARMR
jgi:hypothetical protein